LARLIDLLVLPLKLVIFIAEAGLLVEVALI